MVWDCPSMETMAPGSLFNRFLISSTLASAVTITVAPMAILPGLPNQSDWTNKPHKLQAERILISLSVTERETQGVGGGGENKDMTENERQTDRQKQWQREKGTNMFTWQIQFLFQGNLAVAGKVFPTEKQKQLYDHIRITYCRSQLITIKQ